MLSPSARRGALFLALVALAAAAGPGGCLFAPDRCADLLQCGHGGDGGSGGDGATSTGGPGPTSSTGLAFTPCTTEGECQGSPKPTCDMALHQCRDCSTDDCRVALGGPCAADAACVTGRCVTGKCAACTANAQCATDVCAGAACKAPDGAPCGADEECLGGTCRFGLCRLNINQPCALPTECFTGACKGGTCQSCLDDLDCPGTACGTGKEIGRCLLPAGAGCWPDSQMLVSCFVGTCAGFPATCQ
jgi:hypothetical protein